MFTVGHSRFPDKISKHETLHGQTTCVTNENYINGEACGFTVASKQAITLGITSKTFVLAVFMQYSIADSSGMMLYLVPLLAMTP